MENEDVWTLDKFGLEIGTTSTASTGLDNIGGLVFYSAVDGG